MKPRVTRRADVVVGGDCPGPSTRWIISNGVRATVIAIAESECDALPQLLCCEAC